VDTRCFPAKYAADHLGLDPNLRNNVILAYYGRNLSVIKRGIRSLMTQPSILFTGGGKNEVRHFYDILVILHNCGSAASSKKTVPDGNEAENHCHL